MKTKKLPKKRQLLLSSPKELTKRRSFFEELEEEQKPKNPKHLPGSVFTLFITAITIISFGLIFVLNYILNIQYQSPTNPILIGPVTTTPKSLLISLDQPEDNLLVFDPSLIVSGSTSPNIQVLISTDDTDLIIDSKQDGKFSTVLELEPGLNRIKVVVFDAKGDMRSAQRSVFFTKEKI